MSVFAPLYLSFLHSLPRPLDLDRSNLGNARLQGLAKDVLGGDPTGKRFDWVNSIFFLSYVGSPICKRHHQDLHWPGQILCLVPATLLAKLFPPRLWLGSAAIGWGICSTLSVGHLLSRHGSAAVSSLGIPHVVHCDQSSWTHGCSDRSWCL